MSSGGKMQLAFSGPQNVYLTGQPKMSYFKSQYKRYTNFSMECIDVPFQGNPVKGGKSTAIITHQGDLVQEVFITANTSDILGPVSSGDDYDLNDGGTSNEFVYLAERLAASIELEIGNQQIDKHYSLWWRLFSEMYHDDSKRAQRSKLVCPDSAGINSIKLPLIFFFNRTPGLALPLLAMNQQVRLSFNWSSDIAWDHIVPATVRCSANYIYLDTDERDFMKSRNQAYLIEQVQYGGSEIINDTGSTRVGLNFKHPVKQLVWCFPNTSGIDRKHWNYSTKDVNGITVPPPYVPASAGPPVVIQSGNATQPHLSGGIVRLNAGNFVSETTDGPLADFKLSLNKHNVCELSTPEYFSKIQPHQHTSGSPSVGVYSYSFALQPERFQPTGSCNMSRVEDASVIRHS